MRTAAAMPASMLRRAPATPVECAAQWEQARLRSLRRACSANPTGLAAFLKARPQGRRPAQPPDRRGLRRDLSRLGARPTATASTRRRTARSTRAQCSATNAAGADAGRVLRLDRARVVDAGLRRRRARPATITSSRRSASSARSPARIATTRSPTSRRARPTRTSSTSRRCSTSARTSARSRPRCGRGTLTAADLPALYDAIIASADVRDRSSRTTSRSSTSARTGYHDRARLRRPRARRPRATSACGSSRRSRAPAPSDRSSASSSARSRWRRRPTGIVGANLSSPEDDTDVARELRPAHGDARLPAQQVHGDQRARSTSRCTPAS